MQHYIVANNEQTNRIESNSSREQMCLRGVLNRRQQGRREAVLTKSVCDGLLPSLKDARPILVYLNINGSCGT